MSNGTKSILTRWWGLSRNKRLVLVSIAWGCIAALAVLAARPPWGTGSRPHAAPTPLPAEQGVLPNATPLPGEPVYTVPEVLAGLARQPARWLLHPIWVRAYAGPLAEGAALPMDEPEMSLYPTRPARLVPNPPGTMYGDPAPLLRQGRLLILRVQLYPQIAPCVPHPHYQPCAVAALFSNLE